MGARAQRSTGSSTPASSSNAASSPFPVFAGGQRQRIERAHDVDPFPAPSPARDATGQLARFGLGRPRGLELAQGGPGAGDARPAVDLPGQLAAGPGRCRRVLEGRQRRTAGRPGGTAAPSDRWPPRRARCPAAGRWPRPRTGRGPRWARRSGTTGTTRPAPAAAWAGAGAGRRGRGRPLPCGPGPAGSARPTPRPARNRRRPGRAAPVARRGRCCPPRPAPR